MFPQATHDQAAVLISRGAPYFQGGGLIRMSSRFRTSNQSPPLRCAQARGTREAAPFPRRVSRLAGLRTDSVREDDTAFESVPHPGRMGHPAS